MNTIYFKYDIMKSIYIVINCKITYKFIFQNKFKMLSNLDPNIKIKIDNIKPTFNNKTQKLIETSRQDYAKLFLKRIFAQ